MAANKDDIVFIAEYDDGSKERFLIDPYILRHGDPLARIVARERQQGSPGYPRLKPGKISKVYREEPMGWIKSGSLGWLNILRARLGFNFSAQDRTTRDDEPPDEKH